MDSRRSQKALWLAFTGWVVGFITMLLVKEGNVGQALSSVLMIILTGLVVAACTATVIQRNQ